jgi:hypothetical protein
MSGVDATNLGNAIFEITAGAVTALDEIEVDGYESSILPEMIKKITAGATSA